MGRQCLIQSRVLFGECVHVAFVAALVQTKKRYRSSVSSLAQDWSQSISSRKICGCAGHGSFWTATSASRAWLSALSTERLLAPRQLAASRHAARLQACLLYTSDAADE